MHTIKHSAHIHILQITVILQVWSLSLRNHLRSITTGGENIMRYERAIKKFGFSSTPVDESVFYSNETNYGRDSSRVGMSHTHIEANII